MESPSICQDINGRPTGENRCRRRKYGNWGKQIHSPAQDGVVTDYQSMRYGLASCLMNNGYYYHTDNGATDAVIWYDEFNFNLGSATTSPPTSAYQNGVYRRDFQNGIALVNPKGNGPQTVTLETSYQHLSGQQAPAVNNGEIVTSVTLNDRDGVILQRLAVPQSPTNLSVH